MYYGGEPDSLQSVVESEFIVTQDTLGIVGSEGVQFFKQASVLEKFLGKKLGNSEVRYNHSKVRVKSSHAIPRSSCTARSTNKII